MFSNMKSYKFNTHEKKNALHIYIQSSSIHKLVFCALQYIYFNQTKQQHTMGQSRIHEWDINERKKFLYMNMK